jgi:hypothetical protein
LCLCSYLFVLCRVHQILLILILDLFPVHSLRPPPISCNTTLLAPNTTKLPNPTLPAYNR